VRQPKAASDSRPRGTPGLENLRRVRARKIKEK